MQSSPPPSGPCGLTGTSRFSRPPPKSVAHQVPDELYRSRRSAPQLQRSSAPPVDTRRPASSKTEMQRPQLRSSGRTRHSDCGRCHVAAAAAWSLHAATGTPRNMLSWSANLDPLPAHYQHTTHQWSSGWSL
nr:hypothetical protein CFP56_64859 [Quercus suber]